jgi:adenylate kinase family enzyme
MEKDSERKTLYLETGAKLREFARESSYAAEKTREVLEVGGLMPEFMPIWIWSEFFIKNVSGDEHIILDGVSRRAHEALVIDSVMQFYKREKPFAVFLNVSTEWAAERLKARGRSDDDAAEIAKRMDWYRENVVPALAHFKNNPNYRFLTVNGEQSIEDVHREILEKTNL